MSTVLPNPSSLHYMIEHWEACHVIKSVFCTRGVFLANHRKILLSASNRTILRYSVWSSLYNLKRKLQKKSLAFFNIIMDRKHWFTRICQRIYRTNLLTSLRFNGFTAHCIEDVDTFDSLSLTTLIIISEKLETYLDLFGIIFANIRHITSRHQVSRICSRLCVIWPVFRPIFTSCLSCFWGILRSPSTETIELTSDGLINHLIKSA